MVNFSEAYLLWQEKGKPIIRRFIKENRCPQKMLKLMADEDRKVLYYYIRRFPSYLENEYNQFYVIDICGIKYPLAFILNNVYAYAEIIAGIYIEYFSTRYHQTDEKKLMMEFHKMFLNPYQRIKFKMEKGFFWVHSLFTAMKI